MEILILNVFSLNKTKHRNSLGISTLNSLLTLQFNVPQKCYEFKPSTDLIKRLFHSQTVHSYLILTLSGSFLPAHASEQGNVIGSVRIYIYRYICVYKNKL